MILTALITAIVLGLPYVVGALSSTSEQTFTGFLVGRIGLEDDNSYLGKMMQGAHGLWLGFLPHTGVPHSSTLFFLFYRVLGMLCQVIGISLPLGFHVARLGLAFVFVLVLYRFIAEFVRVAGVRLVALILVIISGGTGWLSILGGLQAQAINPPLEIVSPESYTFWMLYTTPHLILAEILLLCGILLVWHAGDCGGLKFAVLGGLSWLGMAVLQPVFVAVAAAMLGLMTLARSLAWRQIAWRQLGAGVIAGVLASPMLFYSFAVISSDAVYAYWADAQTTLSSSPLSFLASYAVLLLVAVGGVFVICRQRRDPASLFILAWFLLQPLLLYAPTKAQRRLIVGWQIPLCILAAYCLIQGVLPFFEQRFPRRGRALGRGLMIGLTSVTFGTYALLIMWNVASVTAHQPEYYYSASLLAAADWLDQHATYSDGVLASYPASTVIPAYSGVRVHAGHHNETAWVDDRKAEIQQFFQATTSDDWRRDLLRRFNMTYVLYGPEEHALGDFDPARAGYLKEVFANDEVRLYRVEQ